MFLHQRCRYAGASSNCGGALRPYPEPRVAAHLVQRADQDLVPEALDGPRSLALNGFGFRWFPETVPSYDFVQLCDAAPMDHIRAW